MGYKPGKPIHNIVYSIFHPVEFAERKPLLALLCCAGIVFASYCILINYFK